MFSSRLDWTLQPNRISALLADKRRAGDAVIDLTESNPTRAGFVYPEPLLEAFSSPRSLLYEPSPAGLMEARQAVCDYYAARGHSVTPDRVLLTASTSEAYSYAFKLLADPGDEVLVPRPSYPLFGFLAELDSVRITQYSLNYHGRWEIDFDSIKRAVTDKTRAIIVVNPNNPTGSFLKRQELEGLIRVCEEHSLALVCDEVFSDYSFAPDAQRRSTLVDVSEVLTLCLSGLSKIGGLPQMKLGWMVVSGPPALRQQALEKLELIADTYLSVATPVQHALPRLLQFSGSVRGQIAARVRGNLEFLRTATQDSPCHVLQVEGGWYATLQVPRTKTEEEWCLELLDRESVLVQPGFFFDFESEAFLVLSLLPRPDQFQEGVTRLTARIAGN